jgi:hypothetical protein
MKERNYNYLVKYPVFDMPVHTMPVDIINFEPSKVSKHYLHISAIIHLCNRHKIERLKFYSEFLSGDVDTKYISSLYGIEEVNAGKFNNTIKCITAEADSEYFFCSILSQFVRRSNASKIVCKFFNLEDLNVARIKRYIIKEENRYLREIRFEKAQVVYVDNYPTRVYTEYNISYLNSGDGVEDELADNIMHRNRKNFETRQSKVIPILALSKYKERCRLKHKIHKDLILLVVKMVWYANI